MNAIQTVNFHEQSLITLQKDGVAYVAMKPICENIGLDWASQFTRIKRDEVLNSVIVMITTTGADRKIYSDLARPAFNNDVEYDLSESNQIGYKGALLEVIEANNQMIKYKVIKNFN